MLIMSAKITKKKLVALSVICACLILLVIAAVPPTDTQTVKRNDTSVKTNDDRIDYLATFGWTVSSEPKETVEVIIPKEFDSTYREYNILQQSQGFDLSDYKGKTVTRYTYEVENYPSETKDTVNVNLLVYKNKVIAGDVTSTSLGGFMHGLAKPDTSNTIDSDKGDGYDVFETGAGLTPDEIINDILSNTDNK
jgi:hypothetical protein